MNNYSDLTTIRRRLGLGTSDTAWDADILLWLNASSRWIDVQCKRTFTVESATRYYDGAGERLFVDDLLSVTTLKTDTDADGTYENSYTANTDYELSPYDKFPKTMVLLSDRAARSYSDFGGTGRKTVQIVGSWGYGNGQSATPYSDSGAVVNTGNMTAGASTHALATGKGACFAAGQTILIGSEQLRIASISTDTLTFVLNPTRNQNGTTAAAHTSADPIYIYTYPEDVVEACILKTMLAYKERQSGYTGIAGSAEYGEQRIPFASIMREIEAKLSPFVKREFR